MVATLIISLVVVILDQVSKAAILNAKPFHKVIIDNFLEFNLTYNTGAAFGSFDSATWLLAIISLIVSLLLIFYIVKKVTFKKNGIVFAISLAFILGGCTGNLIDRSLTAWGSLSGVVDFIDVYLFGWHFPGTFNVADAFLCVGVGLLIIDMLFIMDKRHVNEVLEEEASEEFN